MSFFETRLNCDINSKTFDVVSNETTFLVVSGTMLKEENWYKANEKRITKMCERKLKPPKGSPECQMAR